MPGRPTSVAVDPEASPYIVVATQGLGRGGARRRRSAATPRYVGLVASPTRAHVVRQWLRDETGLAEERLAALRAPAGHGPRRGDGRGGRRSRSSPSSSRSGAAGPTSSPSPGPATAGRAAGRRGRDPVQPVVDDIVLLDPVCGMTVDRAHARHLAEHDGAVYAFCSIGCRTRFIKDPPRYLAAPARVAWADRTRRYHRTLTPPRSSHPPTGRPRMHPEVRMKFAGTVEIAAPRDTVWAFVIDPNQVGQCGPGRRDRSRSIDETHFKATAKVGIGFISARFIVDMEIAELSAPDRAVIKAHGQAPGSAVDATGDDDAQRRRRTAGRVMDWDADVAISGQPRVASAPG